MRAAERLACLAVAFMACAKPPVVLVPPADKVPSARGARIAVTLRHVVPQRQELRAGRAPESGTHAVWVDAGVIRQAKRGDAFVSRTVVAVQVTGPAGAVLTEVLLATEDRKPCTEGKRPARVALDGAVRWGRPFDVAGSHDVDLSFDVAALPPASVIDFVVTGVKPGCVRLPLAGLGPQPR